jgi:NAD(P) transhydrogenase
VPYEVGVAYYREIARARFAVTRPGRLKLFVHQRNQGGLGVHIIGESASGFWHIGQAVLSLKGTVDYFVNPVLQLPGIGECYKARLSTD